MNNLPISSVISLTGKTAIITGAVGIGLGIAYRLGEAGANILLVGNIAAEVESSVQDLKSHGWNAEGMTVDVSDETDVHNMVKRAVQVFDGIDILVNNAGIYPFMPLATMELTDFEKVIDVNLKGVFLTTKYVSQQMITQGRGGKIINITSIDAVHPSSIGLAHYDASKHAVWGFTKNIALELAQHKIWVNAIAPGGVLTPGVQKAQKNVPESFLQKIPMHRMGVPDDIGKVALFLASDLSSYMTGTQIVVDGGVLLS